MSDSKHNVLCKFGNAIVQKLPKKYKGKNVYWITYLNCYTGENNLIGVGTTIKEAWYDAEKCIKNNNL